MKAPLTLVRSLHAAQARAEAPSTNETPDPDAVLLASLVSAMRTMQEKQDTMDTELRRLRNKVSYLEGVHQP